MKQYDVTGGPTPYESTLDRAVKALEQAADALDKISKQLAGVENACKNIPGAILFNERTICDHFWNIGVETTAGLRQRCVRCGIVRTTAPGAL